MLPEGNSVLPDLLVDGVADGFRVRLLLLSKGPFVWGLVFSREKTVYEWVRGGYDGHCRGWWYTCGRRDATLFGQPAGSDISYKWSERVVRDPLTTGVIGLLASPRSMCRLVVKRQSVSLTPFPPRERCELFSPLVGTSIRVLFFPGVCSAIDKVCHMLVSGFPVNFQRQLQQDASTVTNRCSAGDFSVSAALSTEDGTPTHLA